MRRVPESGEWTWRRARPDLLDSDEIVVRRQGRRLEIRLPDCVMRADGDAGAIAWPGLGLVELGNWGEAVRQMADRWLPWLPHRTNEELARMFHVVKLDGGRLRLIPIGLPASAKTWLEVEFTENWELPGLWRSYIGGKLAGELWLCRVYPTVPEVCVQLNVALKDGAGKALTSWARSKSHEPLPAGAIPELAAGWDGYVRLDWRSKEPAVDRPVRQAIEAIGKSDWPAAIDHLGEATKLQPRQPLLLLLTVWCYEHDPVGHRDQIVALLKEVARQGPAPLARFIAEGNFSSLQPAQRYAILMSQPVERLTAEDWDCLARAAVAAGKLDEALGHARAALGHGRGGQFDHHYAVVELLLRLEKGAKAVETAKGWALFAAPSAEQLAAMAELLAKYGRRPAADEFFVRALAAKDLTPQQRFALVCRRAVIHEGQERWRMLMDATELVPIDSPGRDECLEMILADLNQPGQAEVAGQLAARTHDPRLWTGLMLRQADLTASLGTKADLEWQVYQAGRLPADQFFFAFTAWNGAGQPERVIEAAEQRLRNGKLLGPMELQGLEAAYRAVGRERDAQRAATRDPDPPARGPSPAFPGSLGSFQDGVAFPGSLGSFQDGVGGGYF